MKNIILLILSLAVFTIKINAQRNTKLSADAKISLITTASGDEMHTLFGHSAIRVFDPITRIDWTYNYGTFSFDQPDFYTKFARGKMDYFLSVNIFSNAFAYYKRENRGIREQILDLNAEQRQTIFDFLQKNALPENKYYRYDFFFDNCATRIRDGLKLSFGESIIFNDSTEKALTFRDLLHHYTWKQPWQGFFMNTLLGKPTDNVATASQYMFLPEFLEEAFDNAQIADSLHGFKPLVKEKRTLFVSEVKANNPTFFAPIVVFWLLLVLITPISIFEFLKKNRFRSLDTLLFSLVGIYGVVISAMWGLTEHKIALHNFNVIWSLPLNLLLIWFTLKTNINKFIRKYFLCYSIAMVLLAMVWSFLPHKMEVALIPLTLVLAQRAFLISRKIA